MDVAYEGSSWRTGWCDYGSYDTQADSEFGLGYCEGDDECVNYGGFSGDPSFPGYPACCPAGQCDGEPNNAFVLSSIAPFSVATIPEHDFAFTTSAYCLASDNLALLYPSGSCTTDGSTTICNPAVGPASTSSPVVTTSDSTASTTAVLSCGTGPTTYYPFRHNFLASITGKLGIEPQEGASVAITAPIESFPNLASAVLNSRSSILSLLMLGVLVVYTGRA